MFSWKLWKQRRHLLIFLTFLGTLALYICRVNLSVAIVAMKRDRFVLLENGTVIKIGPEFDWNNIIQGYLLSGFFYGYMITPVIGGALARLGGGKGSFGLTVAGTAIFSLVSPWLARWSEYALLVARIVTGLLEGVTYPSIYILLAAWIPPTEKTRATALMHSGNYVGTLFTLLVFGYLAEAAGWESLFWFSGGLCAIWLFFWWRFAAESPSKDTFISQEELIYLQESLKEYGTAKINPIPWRKLLTARPVLAYVVATFCEAWGFHSLVTLIPKYYNDIYHFDISQSGALSALPYLCLFISLTVVGQLSDVAIKKKWLSETWMRKIAICGGFLLQACFLFGAAHWNDITGTVFCMVVSVTFTSLVLSNGCSIPLDLTRQWSSVLYGCAVTCGSVAGIISPTVAGYIVSTENPTVQQWQSVFHITVAIYGIGVVVFLMFGSAKRLSFDYTDDHTIRLTKLNNESVSSRESQRVCQY